VPEDQQKTLEKALEKHEKQHPIPALKRRDGSVIPEGTPVASLLLSGGVATLEVHPEARRALDKAARASARSEPPSTAPA
jgi:DNA topoisomerase-1